MLHSRYPKKEDYDPDVHGGGVEDFGTTPPPPPKQEDENDEE